MGVMLSQFCFYFNKLNQMHVNIEQAIKFNTIRFINSYSDLFIVEIEC